VSEPLEMSHGKTLRGFSLIEFRDLYHAACSIQKSSLATEDAIWFGIDEANPKILASKTGQINPETGEVSGWVKYPIPDDVLITTRMHLTREQVAAILPILQVFVETGELPEKQRVDHAGVL
jgi:hypothetical protein